MIKYNTIRRLILLVIALISTITIAQPKVSFTFDDGTLAHRPGYQFEEWNGMLLDKLDKAGVSAMLFVAGNRKDSERGKHLLSTWNENGHSIANHTWIHPNFNSPEANPEQFQKELLKTDSLINGYTNFKNYFRFPYLKEGDTSEKVTAFQNILREEGYKNGHVTIDASDWYIDSRLIKKLAEDKNINLDSYRDFYLKHIWERAQYYEKLSFEINGRHIKHNLLLHHNLLAALFIDDLITMFRENDWEIIPPDEAFKDPIYDSVLQFPGESLIYALAKENEKYKNTLRYPAEDSRYEKELMDELGL